MDIIEVNEQDKSMTLYVYMMLEWYDETYSLNGFDQIDSFEIKFTFSEKATKIDKIVTVDYCQIDIEDFGNFCGLLRKCEL